MGKLIYAAITSLDGYVADEAGNFDWAEPREDLHRFINTLEAGIGICLYGRLMYEIMAVWEGFAGIEAMPEYIRDYARIWGQEEKIVYSSSLKNVRSAATSLRDRFDPEEVRELKARSPKNLGIGGPMLASAAMQAGLIDEVYLFMHPVLIGGGKEWLAVEHRRALRLEELRRFEGGVVMLHYGLGGASGDREA